MYSEAQRRRPPPRSQTYDVAPSNASGHYNFHLLEVKLFNLGNRYFGLIIIVIDCGDAGDVVIYVSYKSYSHNSAMRGVCLHLREATMRRCHWLMAIT